MNKNTKYLLSIIISIGIMIYLLNDYPLYTLIETIENINFTLIFPGMLSLLIIYIVSGSRWRYLFCEYPLLVSINGVIVGYAANSIIPARIGEILRSVYLKKETGISITKTIGKIILERILDMVSIFTFLIISIIGIRSKVDNNIKTVLFSGIILISILLIIIIINKKQSLLIEKLLISFKGKSILIDKTISKVLELLAEIRNVKIINLIIGQFISFFITLSGILALWFMLNGSGISISYYQTLLIFPLIILSITLPVSIGYVGVYHASMVFSLAYIGIKGDDIIGKVIIVHILTVLPPIIYGWILIFIKGIQSQMIENK